MREIQTEALPTADMVHAALRKLGIAPARSLFHPGYRLWAEETGPTDPDRWSVRLIVIDVGLSRADATALRLRMVQALRCYQNVLVLDG